MSKRDLSGALARSVSSAAKQNDDEKFQRAEEYLETKAGKAAPIAPNTPEPKVERKKVVRDTFSFPEDDYQDIKRLQDKLIKQGYAATKSEALRLSLKVALGLKGKDLEEAFLRLEKLKPGRPRARK